MLLLEYKYDDFYSVFFQSFESNHGVFTKPLYCVTKILVTELFYLLFCDE